MLINRTPYNAELHALNQKKHGSWVLALVPKASPKPCEQLL